MDVMSPAAARVAMHTSEKVNQYIRDEIEKSVACHAAGGSAAIDRRLAELDQERYALKALRGDFQDLPRAEEDPLIQAQEVVRRVCR